MLLCIVADLDMDMENHFFQSLDLEIIDLVVMARSDLCHQVRSRVRGVCQTELKEEVGVLRHCVSCNTLQAHVTSGAASSA